MSVVPRLRPREDTDLADRLIRSVAESGVRADTEDVRERLADRARTGGFGVDRVRLDDLDAWSFQPSTGNLVHDSGRFFSVEGLHCTADSGAYTEWHQPVIRQPEAGILGILAKEFDGVLHFLMQAKMEPGNSNLVQLSPTVQATRSNYTKVHGGSSVAYIEYFTSPERGRVLVDVLQSEHGAWFYRKSNRNMLVEAIGDVPARDGFHWLTLGQIGELLKYDNVVNMDARTVLACCPIDRNAHGERESHALHSDAEFMSWFTQERADRELTAERVRLAGLPGWRRHDWAIDREDGRFFSVVGVSVRAGTREVARWSQPLIEPRGEGVVAFLTKSFGGIPHVLVNARVEGGFLDTVELAPTVQCTPGNHVPGVHVPFLEPVLAAPPAHVRYSAVHSEEGGRFLSAESRYLVVEATGDAVPPPGYFWATPGQLRRLVAHGHYLNVQARSLLACMNTGAVGL